MTIQYDGSGFHGWQVQAKERTVQGDIEHALSVIYPKEKITLIGAGRTDTGAHALNQVAHIKLPSKLTPKELQQALNGILQQDIFEELIRVVPAIFSTFCTKTKYKMKLLK